MKDSKKIYHICQLKLKICELRLQNCTILGQLSDYYIYSHPDTFVLKHTGVLIAKNDKHIKKIKDLILKIKSGDFENDLHIIEQVQYAILIY